MRFLVIVPASKDSEAGILPDEKMLAALGSFNAQMVRAGVLLAAEGLQASAKGARVEFAAGETRVVDGPFDEERELIAGFWLIQAKSKEEAVAWMRRAPFGTGVVLEIRQVFEAADFASRPSLPGG